MLTEMSPVLILHFKVYITMAYPVSMQKMSTAHFRNINLSNRHEVLEIVVYIFLNKYILDYVAATLS